MASVAATFFSDLLQPNGPHKQRSACRLPNGARWVSHLGFFSASFFALALIKILNGYIIKRKGISIVTGLQQLLLLPSSSLSFSLSSVRTAGYCLTAVAVFPDDDNEASRRRRRHKKICACSLNGAESKVTVERSNVILLLTLFVSQKIVLIFIFL